MAGFLKGIVTGAIAGTVFALLTSDKTGAQRQRDVQKWVKDTQTDISNLADAANRFKESSARLQTSITDNLEPAMDAINTAVEHYEFRTKPHVAAINESLERINHALPDDLTASPEPEAPAKPDVTPTVDGESKQSD